MQPVLAVMYMVQYMPTVGYWLMDKVTMVIAFHKILVTRKGLTIYKFLVQHLGPNKSMQSDSLLSNTA